MRNFGNLPRVSLDPPPNIKQCVQLALECGAGSQLSVALEASAEDSAQQVLELLVSKAGLLSEYFGITINAQGELEHLPCLLEHYSPVLLALPLFLLRLAFE